MDGLAHSRTRHHACSMAVAVAATFLTSGAVGFAQQPPPRAYPPAATPTTRLTVASQALENPESEPTAVQDPSVRRSNFGQAAQSYAQQYPYSTPQSPSPTAPSKPQPQTPPPYAPQPQAPPVPQPQFAQYTQFAPAMPYAAPMPTQMYYYYGTPAPQPMPVAAAPTAPTSFFLPPGSAPPQPVAPMPTAPQPYAMPMMVPQPYAMPMAVPQPYAMPMMAAQPYAVPAVVAQPSPMPMSVPQPVSTPTAPFPTGAAVNNQTVSLQSSRTATRVRVRGPGLINSSLARLGERLVQLGRTRIETVQETDLESPPPQPTGGIATISTTTATPLMSAPPSPVAPPPQPQAPQPQPPQPEAPPTPSPQSPGHPQRQSYFRGLFHHDN